MIKFNFISCNRIFSFIFIQIKWNALSFEIKQIFFPFETEITILKFNAATFAIFNHDHSWENKVEIFILTPSLTQPPTDVSIAFSSPTAPYVPVRAQASRDCFPSLAKRVSTLVILSVSLSSISFSGSWSELYSSGLSSSICSLYAS